MADTENGMKQSMSDYKKKLYKQEKQEEKAEKAYFKKHKNMYKLKGGDIVFYIIDYLIFGLFTLACFFPFYYLFINTISDNTLVMGGQIALFPRGIHFDNYVTIFRKSEMFKAFAVSVARTIIGTALMVLASAFVGYLVTKQEMWHRKFFYRFLLITMYFNAGLIPWYMNMSMLGLTNNFLAYIIPGIVAPYNIILVKTYIESIPHELEESAQMDGAGYLKVFWNIIWPLSKPILATIAIFGAVGNWNSFTDSLMLMQSAPDLRTLQHLLYIYLNQTTDLSMSANANTAAAASATARSIIVSQYTVSMVSIIPILLVYPFMMKYFEKGIMLGAVKG
jgi:putative aldouronate transport system permease protein